MPGPPRGDCKSCVGQPTVGSNPSPSARKVQVEGPFWPFRAAPADRPRNDGSQTALHTTGRGPALGALELHRPHARSRHLPRTGRSSGPSPTCSTRKGSPEAEAFVKARALRLLSGEVSQVVKGLRGIIIGAAPPGVIVFSRSWSMRNCLPADQLRSAGGLDPGQQGGTTAYPGARSLSAALVRCQAAGVSLK